MRIAAWGAAGLGSLVLAFLLLCGILEVVLGGRPMPERVGARPPADAGTSFRVAVLGDSQKGIANLANLLEAVRDEKPAFILHTGDLVADNDEGHYRLAALTLERARLEAPFLVVPGNHDVKRGDERFRRECGDPERAFRVGQVAFVTADNAAGPPPDMKRLEERIASVARPGDTVVLAMHVPPFKRGVLLPEYGDFVAWLEGSGVRYLLCGQEHEYVRKKIGETVVIANGVGGDYESWQLQQAVYATVLEVEGSTLTDRAIQLPPEHGFVENLEHLVLGHVAEAYRSAPLGCWGGTFLVILLTAGAILKVIRRKGERVSS